MTTTTDFSKFPVTTNEMQSLEQFVEKYKITMTADWVDSRPDDTEFDDADHWKCVFHFSPEHRAKTTRRMTVYFSMGRGRNGEKPEITEVLNCVAMDIGCVLRCDFEEFCDELGYDPDSRRAERIYQACVKQNEKFEKFVGEMIRDELVYQTEGL